MARNIAAIRGMSPRWSRSVEDLFEFVVSTWPRVNHVAWPLAGGGISIASLSIARDGLARRHPACILPRESCHESCRSHRKNPRHQAREGLDLETHLRTGWRDVADAGHRCV